MKKNKILTAALFCALIAFGCGKSNKTVILDFNNLPDTEACEYMKEACKEAERFEAQFESMSREEKQEAKAILNAFIQQCEGAQELCLRSQ